MKKIVVGLAWQTTLTDNLGVAALAESNIGIVLESVHDSNIDIEFIEFCPTNKHEGISNIFGVNIIHASPLRIKNLLQLNFDYIDYVRRCHVVIDIGQGDSFSDIYGPKRLTYLILSKYIAKYVGVPLIIAPQTIGPFAGFFSKIFSDLALKFADKIFARDDLSLNYAVNRGFKNKSMQVCDVAFRLPYTNSNKFDGFNIGINVSGLLYSGGYTKNNQFNLSVDYKKFIENLIHNLSKKNEYKIHLIGHVNSYDYEEEDDYRVIEQLNSIYPTTIMAPRFTSASEAKTYISKMNFFTGARMHSCIAAFSSGVPVIPQAYSRKFNGLFASLGYCELIDLKIESNDTALKKIFYALENIDEIKVLVDNGNKKAQEMLMGYQNFLIEKLKSL